MIINSRKDLDNAPDSVRNQFMTRLAAGINKWKWENDEWVIRQDDSTIKRFGFTLDDFPDAPIPDMPDYNPDERALQQARESASLSRANFKLALLEIGELNNVKAVMDDPATDPRIKIMWDDSGRFERMHPALLELAEVMGYTENQLDILFGIKSNVIDINNGIDINTATAEELESLSGVGASLAQQIIDGRPWATVDGLATISGISQGMVDNWDITV